MSKETFIWTDELVHECIRHSIMAGINMEHLPSIQHIQQFKQSKMPKKDKDYEVIEIENKVGGRIRKTRDDKSWYEVFSLKNFDGFKINAVKRLSDEKVFEVGEEVKWAHHEPFKIIKFRIGLMEEMFSVDSADLSYDINKLTKLPPPKEQSKPEQPKKERIEITQYSNINIPEEKFPAIKAALERVLNDEDDELKVYSKEDHDILIEAAQSAAFNAAREPYCATVMGPHNPKFITFQDYLNHKSKQ